jgi:archaemetzincin
MVNNAKSIHVQALTILTIGSFPPAVAKDLASRVSRRVAVPCRVADKTLAGDLPLLPDREQLDADALLDRLEREHVSPTTFLLGITLRDLAVRIFTFVFGQARRNGRAALVSLARLKPEFYGLPPDPELTAKRAVTEILHESGHCLGLMHCTDFNCIMHFATNVETIDLRGQDFCASCAGELPDGFLQSNGI